MSVFVSKTLKKFPYNSHSYTSTRGAVRIIAAGSSGTLQVFKKTQNGVSIEVFSGDVACNPPLCADVPIGSGESFFICVENGDCVTLDAVDVNYTATKDISVSVGDMEISDVTVTNDLTNPVGVEFEQPIDVNPVQIEGLPTTTCGDDEALLTKDCNSDDILQAIIDNAPIAPNDIYPEEYIGRFCYEQGGIESQVVDLASGGTQVSARQVVYSNIDGNNTELTITLTDSGDTVSVTTEGPIIEGFNSDLVIVSLSGDAVIGEVAFEAPSNTVDVSGFSPAFGSIVLSNGFSNNNTSFQLAPDSTADISLVEPVSSYSFDHGGSPGSILRIPNISISFESGGGQGEAYGLRNRDDDTVAYYDVLTNELVTDEVVSCSQEVATAPLNAGYVGRFCYEAGGGPDILFDGFSFPNNASTGIDPVVYSFQPDSDTAVDQIVVATSGAASSGIQMTITTGLSTVVNVTQAKPAGSDETVFNIPSFNFQAGQLYTISFDGDLSGVDIDQSSAPVSSVLFSAFGASVTPRINFQVAGAFLQGRAIGVMDFDLDVIRYFDAETNVEISSQIVDCAEIVDSIDVSPNPDQIHVKVEGTNVDVPAGLKSVIINNITGITAIDGGFSLGNGRRPDSVTFNATEIGRARGLLPAMALSGGTWQWVGLQPIPEA